LTWLAADEASSAELARRLAGSPALAHALLYLHGEIGAGKTTLVRHLLRALGVTGRIKSPSYAIAEPYSAPPGAHGSAGLEIVHFDFYRFNDPREWEDAGLRELFAQAGLKLVEWPSQAAPLLPMPDLELHLQTLPDAQRQIRLRACSLVGLRLLEAVQP